MFDKAKKIYQLQKQAKQMKRELTNEVVEVEGGNGAITMQINGEMKAVSLKINEEAYVGKNEQLCQDLIRTFNKGTEVSQKIAAEKMKTIPGLQDLLSGLGG